MRLLKLALVLGSVVAVVAVVAMVWPVSAQGTQAQTSRTLVARLTDANANVWVAGVVDPDGWAAVGAASDNDAWNAQHARVFRGRVIDGQFTGQAADGAILTGRHDGSQLQGTVAGQPWSATVVTGGTAGVYVGGNSQEVVAMIEAPDGSRVGRIWSRPTGQHLRTLIFSTAGARSSSAYTLLSFGSAAMQGTPVSVTVLPNGTRQVQTAPASQDVYINYNTSFCNTPFCN
jgi:hypothetical protein